MRNQINVDNILDSLASYAIPGILYKTSDPEDKQLFQLFIPSYFWLSWLQRPGGSETWLPPRGPKLEAKEKKPKSILIYSLVNFMPVSRFWRV